MAFQDEEKHMKEYFDKRDMPAEVTFKAVFYHSQLADGAAPGLMEFNKISGIDKNEIVRFVLYSVENIPGVIGMIEKDEKVMECLSSLHTVALRNLTDQYCKRFHSWFGEVTASVNISPDKLDFWITEMKRAPFYDFTDSNDPRSDVILVVEGKKLYVSKQNLSLHSPVLSAMFYGQFAEKDKKEIELKDVLYEDFVEMLNLIYPFGRNITVENAVALLALGDRFQIKTVTDQVEKLLIVSSKFYVAAKLKISGDYRLIGLQAFCLGALKTTADITALEKTAEYNQFSDPIKAAVLDKTMKILAV